MPTQDGVSLDDLTRYAGMLTVIELSKELGVHPDTIRRWEKKGRIHCVRHPISNYRLFSKPDVVKEVMENESRSSHLRSRVVERAGT